MITKCKRMYMAPPQCTPLFTPSREYIHAMCEEIQASWSPSVERGRRTVKSQNYEKTVILLTWKQPADMDDLEGMI